MRIEARPDETGEVSDRIPDDRIEPVAIAARRLLHEGEITDLSVRNLSIYVGCAPSTLQHRFGSRRSVLAHVAEWIGHAWLDVVRRETCFPNEVFGLYDFEGRHHLRGWLAMGELARGDDRVAIEVALVVHEERRLLERVLPPTSDQPTRDVWVGLVRGLQHDLAARTGSLDADRARAAARAFLGSLSGPRATTPHSA